MFPTELPSNDNVIARRIYQGEEKCLPFVPHAKKLIDKYVARYWKHDPNEFDYVFIEKSLAARMALSSAFTRQMKIYLLASTLDISPLILHNDPDLPF